MRKTTGGRYPRYGGLLARDAGLFNAGRGMLMEMKENRRKSWRDMILYRKPLSMIGIRKLVP